MSLEECKRIADDRLAKARACAKIRKAKRRAGGWVDDGRVEINLYADHIGFPNQTWTVNVWAYSATSAKRFKKNEKDSAENYFEKLVQKYGLKEADG